MWTFLSGGCACRYNHKLLHTTQAVVLHTHIHCGFVSEWRLSGGLPRRRQDTAAYMQASSKVARHVSHKVVFPIAKNAPDFSMPPQSRTCFCEDMCTREDICVHCIILPTCDLNTSAVKSNWYHCLLMSAKLWVQDRWRNVGVHYFKGRNSLF